MSKTIKNLLIFSLIISSLIITSGCKSDPVAPSNNPPVVNSVQVNPSTVAANGIATITVNATDPNSDNLAYAYDPNGGSINGNGSSVSWNAPGTAGAYSVTVTVNDGNGGEDTGSGNLTVTAPVTQVVGVAYFPAGTNADLRDAKVSLYTSIANWNANIPVKYGNVSGDGINVSFTLANVNPGNYYLDVWKDIDNTATWTTDDLVGWYGSGGLGSINLTEFQIAQGQTVSLNIPMFFWP